MKIKNLILFIQVLLLITIIIGCTKNESPTNNNVIETTPAINNIVADKTQIFYGGEDMAIISCNATGGNLDYTWQVDLGDLVPMNSERSKVSFSGAACCVGEKTITCTVSNSKGTVSKNIIITILEVIKVPEIISIESDKTELQSSTGEKANIVCYAIGGNLKYTWEADCGDITVNQSDNSKITYTANDKCIGTKNIKCTVTNEKGTVTDTYQIVVK
jgi:hypothetical protein